MGDEMHALNECERGWCKRLLIATELFMLWHAEKKDALAKDGWIITDFIDKPAHTFSRWTKLAMEVHCAADECG